MENNENIEVKMVTEESPTPETSAEVEITADLQVFQAEQNSTNIIESNVDIAVEMKTEDSQSLEAQTKVKIIKSSTSSTK